MKKKFNFSSLLRCTLLTKEEGSGWSGVGGRLLVVVAGVWGSVGVRGVRWSVGLDDWGGVSWGNVSWSVRLNDWGRVGSVGWGGVGVWLHGDLVGVGVGGGNWGVVDGWGDDWGLVGWGHVAAVGWGGVGVRWVGGVARVGRGYIAGVGWGGVAAVGWCGVAAVGWGSVGVASDWGDVSGRDGGQEGGEGDNLEVEERRGQGKYLVLNKHTYLYV